MDILQALAWIAGLVVIFALVCYATIMLKRGIVWIFRRGTGADVRDQQYRDAEKRRFRTPDWQFFQEHLERPVHPGLVSLYSAHDISEWPMVRLKDREARLCAIDSQSISSGTAEVLGHEVVPLAFDDCGQVVYLKPGRAEPDAVYVYDAGEEQVLFESVGEYVENVQANR